jgi:hypothetical protein
VSKLAPNVEAILARYQRAVEAARQQALDALANTTPEDRHGLSVEFVLYMRPTPEPERPATVH